MLLKKKKEKGQIEHEMYLRITVIRFCYNTEIGYVIAPFFKGHIKRLYKKVNSKYVI